jgi:pimeloyl-ACP methyl ester carboxylesterase
MIVSWRLSVSVILFCVAIFLSACGGGGGGSSSGATTTSQSSSALSSVVKSRSILASSSPASSAFADSSYSNSILANSSLSSLAQSSNSALGYSQQAVFDDWFYEVTGYPDGFNFFLYVPITYKERLDARYPLLIVLHGDNGYRELRPELTTYPLPTGVFNSFLLESGELTPAARDGLNPHLKDAFVVHPEIPHIDRAVFRGERLGWWNPEALNDMVAYLAQTYRIDERRIYVVGASMGGAGTFYYAATNPQKIAAIAPVCNGLYDYFSNAFTLRDMPVWMFHNYDDDTVQFMSSILPTVNQFAGQDVWALYPSVKPPVSDYTIGYSSAGITPWVSGSDHAEGVFNFTLYAKGGHNAWDKTFAKDAVWDWLFSKTSH